MSSITRHQATQLMSVPKVCGATLVWAERPNHRGLLLASAQPEDDTGALIPGLTLQLEIKKPVLVDRCLYEFGMFVLDRGVRRRVYQVNVSPPDKRSHNSPGGAIYGPHEHIGDQVLPIDDPTVACGHPEVAFAFFCRQINLSFSGAFNSPL